MAKQTPINPNKLAKQLRAKYTYFCNENSKLVHVDVFEILFWNHYAGSNTTWSFYIIEDKNGDRLECVSVSNFKYVFPLQKGLLS